MKANLGVKIMEQYAAINEKKAEEEEKEKLRLEKEAKIKEV